MLHDLLLIGPLQLVIVLSVVALLASVVPVRGTRSFMGRMMAMGFALAFLLVIHLWENGGEPESQAMAQTLSTGPATLFAWAILLLVGFSVVLTAADYLPAQKMDHGEFYALVGFSVVGMMVMVAAKEFFTLFIGLEIMSMAIYVLCGFKRSSIFSAESSIKYFILGSVASAIFLLGIAFAYGTVGTTSIVDLGDAIGRGASGSPYAALSMIFLFVGFMFKVAAVPFHMWAPDVYEGAPTPITGLMATGVKTAALISFARVFLTAFPQDNLIHLAISWPKTLEWFACITIIYGNLAALAQSNVKRMLGYSAIAHTGYLLMGLAALGHASVGGDVSSLNALSSALLFYLLVYAVSNLVAFGVLSLFGARNREDIDNFILSGAARKHPVLGLVLSMSLLSLAGIPPVAGFFAKLYLLREVMIANPDMLWLIIVAVLGSALSAYYYLRPIVRMYMYAEYEPVRVIRSGTAQFGLAILTFLLLHAGLQPSRYVTWTEKAAADMTLKSRDQASAGSTPSERRWLFVKTSSEEPATKKKVSPQGSR
jgi:NADH-quinone oxidoreductase subunit N